MWTWVSRYQNVSIVDYVGALPVAEPAMSEHWREKGQDIWPVNILAPAITSKCLYVGPDLTRGVVSKQSGYTTAKDQ